MMGGPNPVLSASAVFTMLQTRACLVRRPPPSGVEAKNANTETTTPNPAPPPEAREVRWRCCPTPGHRPPGVVQYRCFSHGLGSVRAQALYFQRVFETSTGRRSPGRATRCHAIVLPGRKAGFRARVRPPDSSRESVASGRPRPAGGPILRLSLLGTSQNSARKPDFGPKALLRNIEYVASLWNVFYTEN